MQNLYDVWLCIMHYAWYNAQELVPRELNTLCNYANNEKPTEKNKFPSNFKAHKYGRIFYGFIRK